MGGENSLENIVKLTAREHYLAHLLLTKMTEGTYRRSMVFALSYFNTQNKNHNRSKCKSRWYEYCRKMQSEIMKGTKPSQKCIDAVRKAIKGKPLKDEHRKKLSIAFKQYIHFYAVSPENIYYQGPDFKQFCIEHNLKFKAIYDTPRVTTAGKLKGWIFCKKPILDLSIRETEIKKANENRSKAIHAQWTDRKITKGIIENKVMISSHHIQQIFPLTCEWVKFLPDLDISLGNSVAHFANIEKKIAVHIIVFDEWCEKNMGKSALLNQLTEFENNGWRILQIFEDELINSPLIVNSRVKHLAKMTDIKIHARKCELVLLDKKQITSFFKNNHIQGPGRGGQFCIALQYNGETVCAGLFGLARFNPHVKYELIRFASAINTSVIGGASKIMAYALNQIDGNIISYADRRYSDGNLYRQLGFKEQDLSYPCYWYIDSNGKKFHRSSFMKHKLAEKLEIFDASKSETENMKINGWNRIFDSGNYVFIYEHL